MIWTPTPPVVVLILLLLSTLTLNAVSEPAKHPGVTIEVDGFQWQWTFHYLDGDADPKNDVSVTGPPATMGVPFARPITLPLVLTDAIHPSSMPALLVRLRRLPPPAPTPTHDAALHATPVWTHALTAH